MMGSLLSSLLSKRYLVRLHGRNFKLEVDGGAEVASFLTTRFVDASDESQAIEKAKARVLNELSQRLNTDDDPPLLTVDEMFQVKWSARRFRKQGGFTFYGVNPKVDEPSNSGDTHTTENIK
jgi:hypothetical protein